MHYYLYSVYHYKVNCPIEQVWKAWSQQDVTPLVDICPADEPGEQMEMLRCIQIGLLYVKDDPQLWPTMTCMGIHDRLLGANCLGQTGCSLRQPHGHSEVLSCSILDCYFFILLYCSI
jgi:hypothetical protein